MTLTNVFKFNIGEVVQFKNAPYHIYLVIEQNIQVCSGGQQVKYLVRGFNKEKFGGVSDNYSLFNEIELEAVEKKEENTPSKEDPMSHINNSG